MIMKSTTLIAAALAVAVATSPARAQEEKTTIALPALTITFTPVYVAQDTGIWKKEGLDVTIHDIVGLGSTNAMLSGSVDFAVQSGPTLIRGNARGQKMMGVSLMAAGVAFELTLRKEAAGGMTMATPVAERAKTLKGKKIAVDSPNSVVEVPTVGNSSGTSLMPLANRMSPWRCEVLVHGKVCTPPSIAPERKPASISGGCMKLRMMSRPPTPPLAAM